MSFPKMTEMHTNCFRFRKFESIFSRPLLNFIKIQLKLAFDSIRGGRVVQRCWVNFQCRGVLLIWIIVGQGPIALANRCGWGLFGHFFSHLSLLFSFSLSLWETARYRLKYCLKGPLNPEQPTNQSIVFIFLDR